MNIRDKSPATIDDILVVETAYIPNRAAKLTYEYRIYNKKDNALVLEARSTQLIQAADRTL